jgi:glycerol-3-phosphate cytidylyltransferase
MNSKRILVDMSVTILHHGHIRLLQKAKNLGTVVVALTTDEEILAKKGYLPELNFDERKEILSAIKYVDEVISAPWIIDQEFLIKNNIDKLVHGDDNVNPIKEENLIIFPRTEGISSKNLRKKSYEIIQQSIFKCS